METRAAKRRAAPASVSHTSPPSKRLRKPTVMVETAPKTSGSCSASSRTSRSRKKYLSELPYHILLEIFLYASERNFLRHGWPDSAYLLRLATMCRSFYEPAISALYQNPPTEPAVRAHQLRLALRQRPELGRKIKRLFFEVDPLLRLTTSGHGHFDVAEFVRKCTNLKELWVARYVDLPPYRWGTAPSWRYPDALFDALEGLESNPGGGAAAQDPIRLQSWRWNGLFTGGYEPEDITRIYLRKSFQSLKRLSIIYMMDAEGQWAPTLSLLPSLEELELECCDLAAESISGFASTASNVRLRALSFINCSTLESDWLSPLLLSPICSKLERLSVLHCRSCDLSFLPAFFNTPQLRSLSFDGRYFASIESHNDAKPTYSTLLPLSAVPVWPSSLISLKLLNLRKWSADEVEAFLDSLISAAPDLPRMRELSLHCILDDLGWRERARVRDKYERMLLHAFVRPSSVPAATAPTTGPARRVSARTHIPPPSDVFEEENQTYRGFCEPDRVDIKMDNARPTEMHFDEEDFVQGGPVLARTTRGRRGGRGRGRGGSHAGRKSWISSSDEEAEDEDYVD
ncbi:hypothetical protein FN846DRAFT_934960 [Sphaerosporella brunnea]|uniref:F-box domain-containing protein n=1 Tax=Sphaerosporella brunnea TaxID=1250544 RepID=A0A5J5F5T2_9PEZI|nr:hypothetical protein FN846DRAFT_934960 [Sphaerosporella brunnea]